MQWKMKLSLSSKNGKLEKGWSRYITYKLINPNLEFTSIWVTVNLKTQNEFELIAILITGSHLSL